MHHGHSHSTQSEEEYHEGLAHSCTHSQPCHINEEGDGGGGKSVRASQAIV
jgi:hypothetical protein